MAHLDDEEQHLDRFDVDNDFEGGEWIGGEYFHRGKRQKRQQTAVDRIYGVFAENSSDEEDFKRKKRDKQPADYTKPVGFVSSGTFVQQPPQDGAAPRPSTSQPARATAGLGSSGAGAAGGLGFVSAGARAGGGEEDAHADRVRGGIGASTSGRGADGEEEEEIVLPSAFGKRCGWCGCAACAPHWHRTMFMALCSARHCGGLMPRRLARCIGTHAAHRAPCAATPSQQYARRSSIHCWPITSA